MSYYAKWGISIDCPDQETADKVAEYFRTDLGFCFTDEVDVDFRKHEVNISCYTTGINSELFRVLTAIYPGTFVSAQYYGEDEEIGVIYAKDGRSYTAFAEIIFPDFDPSVLEKEVSGGAC